MGAVITWAKAMSRGLKGETGSLLLLRHVLNRIAAGFQTFNLEEWDIPVGLVR